MTEQKGYFGSKCCNFWLLYAITTKFGPDTAHMLKDLTKKDFFLLPYFLPELLHVK